MYAIYKKSQDQDSFRYRFLGRISLFGCNIGYIPWLLSKQFSVNSAEPLPWHVNVESSLKGVEQEDQTLVTDLKPRNKEVNLSLYEVMNVWSYSDAGWSPIMLHLRGLFIDRNPENYDKTKFTRFRSKVDEPIFSMMYLQGTVKGGQLEGRWTPPGPSPTNSVLLWPKAYEYFWQQAKRIIDSTAHASSD